MSKPNRYTLGADIPAGEVLRDTAGRPVDDAYVEAAVDAAREYMRGRGRPSLSAAGESLLLRARLPADLDQPSGAPGSREPRGVSAGCGWGGGCRGLP